MSKYNAYDNMQIKLVRCTSDPDAVISTACSMTQKRIVVEDSTPNHSLIEYLFRANHQSPLEHASITVIISGVSRSFLAQITRHRMGSFTSASQHYTTYNEFPNVISKRILTAANADILLTAIDVINRCDIAYTQLIELGIPKEEARQLLPNSKAVNIMWTVNARSLINFFNQRLCKRNVEEMYVFARRMKLICTEWFPTLFSLVGPDCKTLGGCTQGHMKAKVCVDADVPNFKR